MWKKIWNIINYVLLVVVIISLINALYLHELRRIPDGIILILFFISMMLREKSSKPNKFVSIVYYTTSAIIVASTMLDVFERLIFKR